MTGSKPINDTTNTGMTNIDQYYDYYKNELNLFNKEIQSILSLVNDKELFDKELAWKLFCDERRLKMQKQLCLAIRANNPEYIEKILDKKGWDYSIFGIDVMICDCNNNDKIKLITEYYEKKVGFTTHYIGITKEINETDTEAIYKLLSNNYEYILLQDDNVLIELWPANEFLYNTLVSDIDLIIINNPSENTLIQQSYDRADLLFRDCLYHIMDTSNVILSSKLIKKGSNNKHNLSQYHWYPLFIFYTFENTKINVKTFNYNIKTKLDSKKNIWGDENPFEKWGPDWYDGIMGLPEIYNEHKYSKLKIAIAGTAPFDLRQLVLSRSRKYLTTKKYQNNQEIVDQISGTEPWAIYLVSIIPVSFCRHYFKNENGKYSQLFRKILNKCEQHYHKKHPIVAKPDNFDLDKRLFLKNNDNEDVVFDTKTICMIIPTANKPLVIRDHLNAIIKMTKEYNVDVIVYDSSDNEDTKNIVDSLKGDYSNLIYQKYEGKYDSTSLDDKVMSAYEEFSNSYEYLWVLRDRSGVNLNSCARWLSDKLESKPDMISIHNPWDKSGIDGTKQYSDCKFFFKEQFTSMTTLGQTIVKSSFIKNVLSDVPLDRVKNYTLWQPIAFFEYIANHEFLAFSFVGDVFIYHPSALNKSFWFKKFVYQWIIRYYEMLNNLPETYKDEMYDMLKLWNDQYHLLDVPYLLAVKSEGYLKTSDVKDNEEKIQFLSTTPLEYYYEISKMSKRKAKKIMASYGSPEYYLKYSKTDHSKLGNYQSEEQDQNL